LKCPECKSTSLQPCGFKVEVGKPAIAHYVCLGCYCAFGGSFLTPSRESSRSNLNSRTTDEEDIL